MSSNRETVEFVNGELVITNLCVGDAVAVAYVQKHDVPARADALRNAVQLGARVIEYASDHLGTSEFTQRIDASAEAATKVLRAVSTSAKDTIDSQMSGTFGKNGRMEALLASQLGSFKKDLERHLDPQTASSLLGRFKSEMSAAWTQEVATVSKLFDLDQPGSVTNRLLGHIDAHHKTTADLLTRIVQDIAVRNGLRAERARGTAKGTAFEDDVERTLAAWSVPRHDRVTRCGSVDGTIPRAKAGDFVVEIAPGDAGGPGLRIVLEVRDRKTGETAARRDLERAMENRAAVVGIYVTTDASAVPRGCPPVFFLDPNRVFVLVDYDETDGFDPTLLQVALEVARARALMAWAPAPRAMDVAAISARVTAAINASSRLTEVKKNLTGIGTGLDRVKSLVDEIRTDVRSALADLHDEIERQVSLDASEAA